MNGCYVPTVRVPGHKMNDCNLEEGIQIYPANLRKVP